MSAHTTADDRRTADQSPTTVRLDDLADRAEALVEDDTTEFDTLSDVLREGVRRLVTRHECEQRLTAQGETHEDVPANLDAVVERSPDTHPMRADGGEDA